MSINIFGLKLYFFKRNVLALNHHTPKSILIRQQPHFNTLLSTLLGALYKQNPLT